MLFASASCLPSAQQLLMSSASACCLPSTQQLFRCRMHIILICLVLSSRHYCSSFEFWLDRLSPRHWAQLHPFHPTASSSGFERLGPRHWDQLLPSTIHIFYRCHQWSHFIVCSSSAFRHSTKPSILHFHLACIYHHHSFLRIQRCSFPPSPLGMT